MFDVHLHLSLLILIFYKTCYYCTLCARIILPQTFVWETKVFWHCSPPRVLLQKLRKVRVWKVKLKNETCIIQQKEYKNLQKIIHDFDSNRQIHNHLPREGGLKWDITCAGRNAVEGMCMIHYPVMGSTPDCWTTTYATTFIYVSTVGIVCTKNGAFQVCTTSQWTTKGKVLRGWRRTV